MTAQEPARLADDAARLRLGNRLNDLRRGRRNDRGRSRGRSRKSRRGRRRDRERRRSGRFGGSRRAGRPGRTTERERSRLFPRARLPLLVEEREIAARAQVRRLRQASVRVAVPTRVVATTVAAGAVAVARPIVRVVSGFCLVAAEGVFGEGGGRGGVEGLVGGSRARRPREAGPTRCLRGFREGRGRARPPPRARIERWAGRRRHPRSRPRARARQRR